MHLFILGWRVVYYMLVNQLYHSWLLPHRARPTPGVSKSMNVLDLSAKDKSAKPPRRLSIPTKTSVTPASKRIDSMTPISETRIKRSVRSQAKSDTPSSEVSNSGMSRLFSRISTASYWLSQIKLAETAAKHSISLGFFKLALEAGCEVCTFQSECIL